jgi:hypothetical protein
MFDHIQQDFIEAELAYKRERLTRSFAGGRRAQHGLVEALRNVLRDHRNPVRGASRYELDGPATRRGATLENYRVITAPHH